MYVEAYLNTFNGGSINKTYTSSSTVEEQILSLESIVFNEYNSCVTLLESAVGYEDRIRLEAKVEVLRELSLKDIGDKFKQAWEWIKELVKKFIDWITGFFRKSGTEKTKKNIDEAKKELQKRNIQYEKMNDIKNDVIKFAKANANKKNLSQSIREFIDKKDMDPKEKSYAKKFLNPILWMNVDPLINHNCPQAVQQFTGEMNATMSKMRSVMNHLSLFSKSANNYADSMRDELMQDSNFTKFVSKMDQINGDPVAEAKFIKDLVLIDAEKTGQLISKYHLISEGADFETEKSINLVPQFCNMMGIESMEKTSFDYPYQITESLKKKVNHVEEMLKTVRSYFNQIKQSIDAAQKEVSAVCRFMKTTKDELSRTLLADIRNGSKHYLRFVKFNLIIGKIMIQKLAAQNNALQHVSKYLLSLAKGKESEESNENNDEADNGVEWIDAD